MAANRTAASPPMIARLQWLFAVVVIVGSIIYAVGWIG